MNLLKLIKLKLDALLRVLIEDFFFTINSQNVDARDKSPELLEWLSSDWTPFVEAFVNKHNLTNMYFSRILKRIYRTHKIDVLMNKWIVDYCFALFLFLDDALADDVSKEVLLFDNPLNRQLVELFHQNFKRLPPIAWKKQAHVFKKLISLPVLIVFVLYSSLKTGVTVVRRRIKYCVMRESLWGINASGGYYFHDDFMVDGHAIKKDDLLLFSRGTGEQSRQEARNEAKNSPYAHFDLNKISVSLWVLFSRILPKYVFGGFCALLCSIHSPWYTFFANIFEFFARHAVAYEKIFSNYDIRSELAHNYFSASHVAESIICQNYGTKYFLMHYTDNARSMSKHLTAYVSCDKFLIWGTAHVQHKGDQQSLFEPTGYVFKEFIKRIKSNKTRTLRDMGIKENGKIVSFFDETFGGMCKMTPQHYVNFWETILVIAQANSKYTLLIKVKENSAYKKLNSELQAHYTSIKARLSEMKNVYFVETPKWSFIETIGVSDIAVTQGIASSATIALISGIEGFYFDQAHHKHPLRAEFTNRLIFDNSENLKSAIDSVIEEKDFPSKSIPKKLLRELDAFDDNRGLRLFREHLMSIDTTGEHT